jgi:hypothetical protein
MIGQYLPNNNETATVAFRQNFCKLNSLQAGKRIASSHIRQTIAEGRGSHRRIYAKRSPRRDRIRGPKRHAGTATRPVLFRRSRARRVPPRAPVGLAAWRRCLAARKRVTCGGPGTRGTRPSHVCLPTGHSCFCGWCTRRHVRAPSKPPALRVLGPAPETPGESAGIWRLARPHVGREIPRFLARCVWLSE